MALKAFFENIETGAQFEVLSMNTDGTVTMKAEYGQFTEPYNKEHFKALGYRLVRKEVADEPEVVDDEE